MTSHTAPGKGRDAHRPGTDRLDDRLVGRLCIHTSANSSDPGALQQFESVGERIGSKVECVVVGQ